MKLLKQHKDTVVGIFFLIISAAYYSQTTFESNNLLQSDYGPEFVPRIYAILTAIFSIILIVTSIIKDKNQVSDEDKSGETQVSCNTFRTIATLILMACYVIALKPLGFLISTVIYITIQLVVIAPRGKCTPVKFFVFAVIVSALLFTIFSLIFHLVLPKGFLGI